jgi:Uncharacterized protein conserved in bacteria
LKTRENPFFERSEPPEGNLKILALGHPYILYDDYLNMNIIKKLERRGAKVVTPEYAGLEKSEKAAASLEKPMFWTYGKREIGAAISEAADKKEDGAIYISAFGCGVDSFAADMVRRRLQAAGVPFMLVTLDEMSGEAGLDTRLEAFADLVYKKKRAQ